MPAKGTCEVCGHLKNDVHTNRLTNLDTCQACNHKNDWGRSIPNIQFASVNGVHSNEGGVLTNQKANDIDSKPISSLFELSVVVGADGQLLIADKTRSVSCKVVYIQGEGIGITIEKGTLILNIVDGKPILSISAQKS